MITHPIGGVTPSMKRKQRYEAECVAEHRRHWTTEERDAWQLKQLRWRKAIGFGLAHGADLMRDMSHEDLCIRHAQAQHKRNRSKVTLPAVKFLEKDREQETD